MRSEAINNRTFLIQRTGRPSAKKPYHRAIQSCPNIKQVSEAVCDGKVKSAVHLKRSERKSVRKNIGAHPNYRKGGDPEYISR